MPELREQTIIEWDVHVTPNNMSYDMIIGRDLLSTLGIIIDFDNQMIEWQGPRIPMRDVDEDPKDHVYVTCLLYTSPSPRDGATSRMPSSA